MTDQVKSQLMLLCGIAHDSAELCRDVKDKQRFGIIELELEKIILADNPDIKKEETNRY